MKYDVLVDSKTVNKEPLTLDKATELVIRLAGRFTVGAQLAEKQNKEDLRVKNLLSRDTIRIVEAKDGQ